MHHLVEHGCSCSLPAVDVLLNKNRMQCTDNIRSLASTGRTWLSPDGFATKCVLLANIFCMRMLYMPLDCTIMIKVKLKGLYIYISNMVSLLFHLCNRDFGMHGSVEYTFVSSNQ